MAMRNAARSEHDLSGTDSELLITEHRGGVVASGTSAISTETSGSKGVIAGRRGRACG